MHRQLLQIHFNYIGSGIKFLGNVDCVKCCNINDTSLYFLYILKSSLKKPVYWSSLFYWSLLSNLLNEADPRFKLFLYLSEEIFQVIKVAFRTRIPTLVTYKCTTSTNKCLLAIIFYGFGGIIPWRMTSGKFILPWK